METKLCKSCNETKPHSEFYTRKENGKTYLRSHCKTCSGKANGKLPNVECPICKTIHCRAGTKRVSNVCPTCYPKYRTLYNILASCRWRAAKLGRSFNLTLDWLYQQGDFCKKTGLKFTYIGNGSNFKTRPPTTPSVDKINPDLGYTTDNCQLTAWWYNVSKQTYSEEEVLSLAKCLVSTSETKPVQPVENVEEIGKEIT